MLALGASRPALARWLIASGFRLPLLLWFAGSILALHGLVALTAPLWAPFSPTSIAVGPALAPPSFEHLFGTDNLGRDVFSRVIYGGRTDLTLALSATALGVFAGAGLGVLSGYVRGWFDEISMRLVDILISIPPLILALLIISSLGTSAPLLVVTVAFFYAPRVARVVRAAALQVVSEDFVAIAKTRGESAVSVASRELVPNVMGTVFVEFAIRSGYAVIFIGSMGFLGFGPPPPTPEWGVMVNEAFQYFTAAPWAVLAPTVAIATLVVALNVFTDSVARILGRSLRWER